MPLSKRERGEVKATYTVYVRIPVTLYDAIDLVAQGQTLSAVVREALQTWVDDMTEYRLYQKQAEQERQEG